jgi:uncharacterized protein YjbI with pentapeptide repeats
MKLISDTPLTVGWLTWAFEPPAMRLVLAVKATFEIPRDGLCTLAAEQAFVTGDVHWDDDVERSVRYDSDLALVKPQGEMWISGAVRSPEPIRELSCCARVGAIDTRFALVGDRWWRADGGMTDPVPFTEMELSWERAFGGPAFTANPAGRGAAADPHDADGRVALPNIEHPDRLIRSTGARPEPAGAWPVPRSWPERTRLMGTYDAVYARTRWPYFAEDFSWRYFQAAREGHRIAGYWRGDEEIELTNLHPAHRVARARLPGFKPRAFLHEHERSQGPLREIGLVLDTIAIDAGEGRAFAIWRGSTPCRSEALDELAHLYVTHEPLDHPRTEREYLGAFVARLRALWEEEQAAEAEASPSIDAPLERTVKPDLEQPAAPVLTAAELLETERNNAIERGMPEEIANALYRIESAPRSKGEGRAKMETAIAVAHQLGLTAAAERLRRALAALPEPSEEPRPSLPRGLATPQELRAEVIRRLAAGETLSGLNLADADLSELDLTGRDLSGSILVRADLRRSRLDGARLDGATFDEAKLEGATLRSASLREASLAFIEANGVDFTASVLDDAQMERASLVGAVFQQVQARRVVLEECLAIGANFARAELEEADLGSSNFDEANFRQATLTDARLVGASLRLACLDQIDAAKLRASDGADFSEATMRWAELSGATFAGSILIGTKMAETNLTRATFAGARLEGAELMAVRARGASFAGAMLAAASLAGADLLGACFEGAQLRQANLSHANLYQAELWRADLDRAHLDGANVEGTKLA